MSNHVVEDQDMGYGPAQYLVPTEVQLLNAELNKVSTEEFKKRFNGPEMNEAGIYREIWEQNEALGYVKEHFTELKTFYNAAAAHGNAVITFIA